MSRISVLLLALVCSITPLQAADLPEFPNWRHAGQPAITVKGLPVVSLTSFGGINDGKTDNAPALKKAIQSLNGQPGIIELPAGTFLFKQTVSLPSGIILRGKGSDKTTYLFNGNGNGEILSIQGKRGTASTPIVSGTTKFSKSIQVKQPAGFAPGDWCVIQQQAPQLLHSDWAKNTFFQLVQITAINGNTVQFHAPLRLDFPLSNQPILQQIQPVSQAGIESMHIQRQDATSGQTSHILFNFAVQCHVKGVEFSQSNYAHITLQSSSFNTVSDNYFHEAFNYGSGGKGYGVVMQFGAGDNLIYNNIFRKLRHAMLLQATANGNVIAYNYSYEPYWQQSFFPTDAAGDIVLHGNYPYANLFEGNIVQNIVIDNSHGINGPDNTFFRNRAENYGIVMNNGSGDKMHFIANEITHTGFLKGLFTTSGSNTLTGNIVKGKSGSGFTGVTTLLDVKIPAKIGAPYAYNAWKNEAYQVNGKSMKTVIGSTPVPPPVNISKTPVKSVQTPTVTPAPAAPEVKPATTVVKPATTDNTTPVKQKKKRKICQRKKARN